MNAYSVKITRFLFSRSVKLYETVFFLLELAILGCNVSKDSVRAAWQLFEDIRPRLNLAPNPPVKNLVPPDVKRYLTENRLKFCVLVVDAETVKDAYDKLTQRKVEYEDLLETAADKVGKKELFLSVLDSMAKA